MNPLLRKKLKPEYLLILLGVAATLAFSVWQVLLNNFAIEAAAFTGREIGILQSLREVPGFLAFTTVFILLILREQVFALLAIAVLGVGVALTGFLPSEYGLYFTTVLMSTGFHYFYTVQQSLTLQWIEKERTPEVMGRLSSASSIAALLAFAVVWAGMDYFGFGYRALYLAAGGIAVLLVIVAVVLYVLDHVLFAMAIAIRSYFQKIADPADIASTAGVSFTINHIAAVVIPVTFGIVWLHSPSIVFIAGAIMAAFSLLLARMVPRDPGEGNEVHHRLT